MTAVNGLLYAGSKAQKSGNPRHNTLAQQLPAILKSSKAFIINVLHVRACSSAG